MTFRVAGLCIKSKQKSGLAFRNEFELSILRFLSCGRGLTKGFSRTIDGAEYVGWTDGARNGRVTGWVSKASSAKRLTVLVETGLNRFSATIADLHRGDSQRAGYSETGYCGFSFPLSRISRPGPIRVFVDDPRFELGGSPVCLPGDDKTEPAVRKDFDGESILAVDPHENQLSGWIFFRNAPTHRPVLLLEHEAVVLAKLRATLYREDAARIVGDGWRGFSFTRLQRPGVYRLRDEETNKVLYEARCGGN